MENALIVYEGIVETDEQSESKQQKAFAELEEARKRLEDETKTLNSVKERIQLMDRELQLDNPDLAEEFLALQQELESLTTKEEVTEDFPAESSIAEEEAFNREQRRANEKAMANRSARLKFLFRRIARLTHPDATKNPEKHKLFIRAREAYKQFDLPALELLYVELTFGASTTLQALLSQLEAIKERAAAVRAELVSIMSGEPYMMAQDWNVGFKEPVRIHFRHMLRSRIQMLRMRIEAIKASANTASPKQQCKDIDIETTKDT